MKIYKCWSTYQRLIRVRNEEFEVHAGSPWPAFKRTWLHVLNYTGPGVLSVQVSARGKSKTSSPAKKREEAERGKCTDKQRRRNTMDSKNSRRFQSMSYFSDDVVESNWGQQMFRGSLLFRSPNDYNEGNEREHRQLPHITHQQNSTDNNIKQFPRIFSVVFPNQYRTGLASKQSSYSYSKQFPQLSSHV